jgi:threonine/homoserine/homoserine lactone efflux protein
MSMFKQAVFHREIWGSALTLIMASLVVMGSPGPSTISATAVGAAYGFRRSLIYVGGLILGTTTVLLAVALGVVTILLSIPHGAPALIAVSTIYVGYLALRIATAPPLANRSNQVAAPAFAGGFLLAIANPKAYLAIASVFAATTIFREDHALDAAVKTALLGAMIVVIHLCWLLAGASLSRWLRDPAISRIVNVGLAGILVVTTVLALLR